VGRLGDRDGRRIAASVARKLPVPSRQFGDGPHPSPEFADFSAKSPVFPLCALIECFIHCASAAAGPRTKVRDVTAATATVSALIPGAYYFRVTASNAWSENRSSNVVSTAPPVDDANDVEGFAGRAGPKTEDVLFASVRGELRFPLLGYRKFRCTMLSDVTYTDISSSTTCGKSNDAVLLGGRHQLFEHSSYSACNLRF
jgi:hypothetical protein